MQPFVACGDDDDQGIATLACASADSSTHIGQVPFAMQPITATTNTNVVTMDITHLLQYALDTNMQIFELYPEQWLSADSPTWPSLVASRQAKYQAALQSAAATPGATNRQAD
jgi:hypothetical protein